MTENLIFIDRSVSNYQSIIDGLKEDDIYYLIASDSDGLVQVSKIISEYTGLNSIHIISHGSEGSFELGSTIYDQSNIDTYAVYLQMIGAALTNNGDILLYGCDVGSGTKGQTFIDTIASYTGADIAASDDITGSSGDWILETNSGTVETTAITVEGYSGTLLPILYNIIDGTDSGETLNGTTAYDLISAYGGDDVVYANSGNDIVYGGTGGDWLFGEIGNDSLYGEDGNDMLLGEAGDDYMDGGNGIDFIDYYGASLGVTVNLSTTSAQDTGGAGIDTIINVENIYGSIYNDDLSGNSGDNVLSGYDGSDYIYGNAGNDTLYGDAGSDSLFGGAGDDTIDGGDGTDWVVYTDAASGVTVTLSNTGAQNTGGGGTDTIINIENLQGSNYNDALYGDNGANILSGLNGDDYIYANAGNDIIYGGYGDDFIMGNEGNDTIYGEAGNDHLIGGAGDDYMDGGNGIDSVGYTDASAGVTVDLSTTSAQNTGGAGTDTIMNFENLQGSNYDDLLSGNSVDNALYGWSGNDIIYGGAGNDYLDGGDGSDVFFGEAGDDSINGGDGIDQIDYYNAVAGVTVDLSITVSQNTGGGGTDTITNVENLEGSYYNDTLSGSSADNLLLGYFGDDYILGNAGNDAIYGGSGNDLLLGGAGNDTLNGEDGTDWAGYEDAVSSVIVSLGNTNAQNTGGGGTDTITNIENLEGSFYSDSLYGNSGANEFYGLDGNDYIYAESGNDVIYGGAGDDYLMGHEGSDTIYGNTGNDNLVGGAGDDYMDGGDGIDSVDYYDVSAGVTVDLSKTSVQDTGGGGIDTIMNFENLQGSNYDDLLFGNSGDNAFYGWNGDDYIFGEEGNDYLNGGDGNDSLLGQAGNDNIYGSSGNDSLAGHEGNDYLNGGDGNDTIYGGTGIDTMVGGLGNDTYHVDNVGDTVSETSTLSTETDIVVSTISYTLGANVENLILSGTDAINATGNSLYNRLTGNDAANKLNGGTGTDIMVGGLGNDTYYVDNLGDIVSETSTLSTEIDTVISTVSYAIKGYVENLTLSGTAAINGTGNTLNNRLTGNSADNVLNGLSGADIMVGGLGNDTYYVDNVGDIVSETSTLSTEIDTVISTVSYAIKGYVENLTLSGTGNISANGNDLDNILIGNNGANSINGIGGADTMIGGLGNDTYYVDNVGDTVTENAGEGTDILISSVSYTLSSNVENMILSGTDSLNAIGNDLNNRISGNNADNILDGSIGADIMVGGLGNDTYYVDNVADIVSETSTLSTEIDTVISTVSYAIKGYVENLTLTGTAINGIGNTLDNTIIGNSMNNSLSGSSGNDTLTGGDGADVFFFNSALNGTTNVDTITDFIALDDTIRLENAYFTNLTTTGTLSAANFVASVDGAAVDANDYILYNTTTGALYYDADGIGGTAAVQFALLGTGSHPTVTNADFLVS